MKKVHENNFEILYNNADLLNTAKQYYKTDIILVT